MRPGSTPDPAGGAYSAPPGSLAGFKGLLLGKGRRMEGWEGRGGKERGGEGGSPEGKGREEEGKEREGGRFDPQFSLPSAAPAYNNKPCEFSC